MFVSVMFAYVMFHPAGHFIVKSVVVLVCIVVVLVLFSWVSSVVSVLPVPLSFSNGLFVGLLVLMNREGCFGWLLLLLGVGLLEGLWQVLSWLFFSCFSPTFSNLWVFRVIVG